jgi:hypothetical protein
MRGRLEKLLPKGYKVAKKKVDRFPEAMREPFLTLAVEHLMEVADPATSLEPLVRLLRNRELTDAVYVRAVEFLTMSGWEVGKLEKMLRKALPTGYQVDEGVIERDIEAMDEPFLTAAGDNLLDRSDPDDEEAQVAMILILCNPNTDERVRDRILDRFSREEWSVLGYERDLERRLPKEFKLHVLNHGQDFRIVRVLARI